MRGRLLTTVVVCGVVVMLLMLIVAVVMAMVIGVQGGADRVTPTEMLATGIPFGLGAGAAMVGALIGIGQELARMWRE
jgi:hypothetical protein